MYEAKSVSEYIKELTAIIESESKKDFTIVYRGENRIYKNPCQPNIFRKEYLYKNEFFEKNLFEEMKANKITEGSTFLERAIDAQHDGFPSRLLDVSYNSLIALYFAVTPYYYESEDKYDKKIKNNENNGVVYIFFIEKYFCPAGDIINKTYDSIVNRDDSAFITHKIFQKNHKLIDHIKSNNRIIAQQGAFILFQGDEISSIPKCYYEKIEIPCEYKAKIRDELKELFGIHTGSVYPEPTNLVKEISKKSFRINNREFNYSNEVELVISNLINELEYYRNQIITYSFKDNKEKIINLINDLEIQIYDYKLGIIFEKEWIDENSKNSDNIDTEFITSIIKRYNEILECFVHSIDSHLKKFDIDISKELKFGEK